MPKPYRSAPVAHELAKIAGDGLREMVAGNLGDTASVIIEVDVPSLVVDFERRQGTGESRPTTVLSPTAQGARRERRVVARAEHELESVLGKSLRWIPAAHAFVARVTPGQLRTIAEMPFILAIRENRTLR